MRSGSSVRGKPELAIDRAWEWVLQQACQEAGKESKKTVKVDFSPEKVSMEMPATPTALASVFGVLSAVLSVVVGFLCRLIRRERLRHRHELLAINQQLGRTPAIEQPPGPLSPAGRAPTYGPPVPPRVRALASRPTGSAAPTQTPTVPLPITQAC
jgi:hypothetical protein